MVEAFMRSGLFVPLLVAAFGVVLASAPVEARDAARAQPALWEMSAGKSKVYLFGSVHMLPRDWPWRTKAIDQAIRASNIFVFETAMTHDERNKMSLFVQDHGRLPHGQKLSRMLSPRGLKDFEKALDRTPLDRQSVETMRPWLALVALSDYQIKNGPVRSFVEEGVDYTLEQEAWEGRKAIRHLESSESQLEMLVQATPDSDIAGFEADLRELPKADQVYRRLLDSWTEGNQVALAKVMASEAEINPDEKTLLLDKRNRNWLPQIEAMMVQNKTIFVTVGAAHLVGTGSVLDMLCVRGWKVQRIKTGPSKPPAACPTHEQGPTVALRSSQAALRP
jgi:uncharacterized protein YbaP (TraB family)